MVFIHLHPIFAKAHAISAIEEHIFRNIYREKCSAYKDS